MSKSSLCPRCGRPLPQMGELFGRCPSCMLERGFESSIESNEDSESANAFATDGDPGENASPVSIGRYRIVRLIGEGGMGAVYEAEQEQPRRTVALKIIKPGMASPQLLRRFEQESQALGRLQHPSIAQIYEAGTVDTGFGLQPYFAMEFIRGSSPRDYAETHHISTRGRLEIMAKICDAVHHAHQRGLIHRDLKPGNILVDETGQPKVLDFGVARVTDSDSRATLQTDMGQLVGTLAYMSPEQALADPLDIDTRTDVYALGVILYELLSGQLPYTISKKLHETIQTIREQDPVRLSVVNRTYRGDIETIVAKALEKDRTRRYASAAEMAADIQHYLNAEPIVARSPSASYHLRRLAQRHLALVAGVAAVFVVLVAGVAASMWQASRATRAEHVAVQERDRALEAEVQTRQQRDRALNAEQAASGERDRAVTAEEQVRGERDKAVAEQQRADREADTIRALNGFLRNDLLTFPDPRNGTPLAVFVKPNPNLTVREALDRAAANIGGKFDGRPLVEAALRETIADSYLSLDLFAEGKLQLNRALELRRTAQGHAHPDTLKALKAFAELLYRGAASLDHESIQKEIASIRKEIVEIETLTLGEEDPRTLADADELAHLYLGSGSLQEAEALLEKTMAIRSRTRSEPDPNSVRNMISLIVSYEKQGKSEPAGRVKDKLEGLFRALGEENEITQGGLVRLADFYMADLQKYAEAEAYLKRVLASRPRFLPPSDPQTLVYVIQLVKAYQQQGKAAEADQLSVVFEGRLRALGENNRRFIGLVNLFQSRTGRTLPGMVDLAKAALSPPGKETLRDMVPITNVAQAYYERDNYAEAESLYARALDVSNRFLAPEDIDSLKLRMVLAGVHVLEGKYDRAEAGFLELLKVNRRASEPDGRLTLLIRTLLAWTRLHQQKYVEVEADLREVLRSFEKSQVEEWERYYCQSILGAGLAGQKKYADAEPLLLSAYDGMATRRTTVSNALPYRLKLQKEGGERIVQLYQDWGKPEKAAEWREKLQAAEARGVLEPPPR